MDYVFLMAGIAVIITCFYFISSPFFTVKEEMGLQKEQTAEEGSTLEAVYSAVNELEMDFLMKKIPENDYKEMKEQYQLLAAKLMKIEPREDEEKHVVESSKQEVDQEILEELRKIREKKG